MVSYLEQIAFYHILIKISPKIFCQSDKNHTFAADLVFILSKP